MYNENTNYNVIKSGRYHALNHSDGVGPSESFSLEGLAEDWSYPSNNLLILFFALFSGVILVWQWR